MQLHLYLSSLTLERRRAFVRRIDRHPVYVAQLAASLRDLGERKPRPRDRKPSPELAIAIEKATRGKVKAFECRRDVWPYQPSRVIHPSKPPKLNGGHKKKSTAKKTRVSR